MNLAFTYQHTLISCNYLLIELVLIDLSYIVDLNVYISKEYQYSCVQFICKTKIKKKKNMNIYIHLYILKLLDKTKKKNIMNTHVRL